MCLFTQDYAVAQLSRFINENRQKNRQKAFLDNKFIQIGLFYRPNKQKRLIFAARRPTRKELKELRVNFEANLSTRAKRLQKLFGIRTKIGQLE